MFQRKKQTLTKENAKQERQKKPPKNIFQKGVAGQKAKKNGIKQNRKKRRTLKRGLLGEQKRKKP